MRLPAFLAAALVAAPALAAEPPHRVVSVHDGDSLRTLEDGPVRIAGIDAPEIGHRARCPAEDAKARAARDYLRARTSKGVHLTRPAGEPDRERYGRLLREVRTADGRDVGGEMVRLGLAVPYHGRGPRMDWCSPR